MYTFFDHTADLGMRVEAPDLNGLFADAASGLFAMIVESVPPESDGPQRRFRVSGERLDHLLFDWLNELLFTFESERLLFADFTVEVGPLGLEATAREIPLDERRDRLLREVKAITYHGLRVERRGEDWIAELIVDI